MLQFRYNKKATTHDSYAISNGQMFLIIKLAEI